MKNKRYLIAIIILLSIFSSGCGGKIITSIERSPKNLEYKTPISRQLFMGNPSNANKNDINNYLVLRKQFAMSYNNKKRTPNWVAWDLNTDWIGNTPRGRFRPDMNLPRDFVRIYSRYYTRSGYNRGHLCPSKDRSNNDENNDSVFVMSNIVPQAAGNNQGPWQELESYCRDIVYNGNQLYIIAGGSGSKGRLRRKKVNIPKDMWKIVVVLKSPKLGIKSIDEKTRIIAVIMPNVDDIENDNWQNFKVNVKAIEKITNYDFFKNIPKEIRDALKEKVDQYSYILFLKNVSFFA